MLSLLLMQPRDITEKKKNLIIFTVQPLNLRINATLGNLCYLDISVECKVCLQILQLLIKRFGCKSIDNYEY